MCLWGCLSLHVAGVLYLGPVGGAGAGGQNSCSARTGPPLLPRVLVLLGAGMLGHKTLGQELKGALAAGAGLSSIDFFFKIYICVGFFFKLPVDETLHPLLAVIAPAPLAELATVQPDSDKRGGSSRSRPPHSLPRSSRRAPTWLCLIPP